MRSSRTVSFRRSVVSVAAAFAAAPGCHVDHAPGGDQINPPSCDDQPGAAGCMPPVDCSSMAPPDRGAPCSREGASCTYDSCTTPEGVGEAVCADGQWQLLVVSCNPPALGCPAERPAGGAPCDQPSFVRCGYGDCYGTSIFDAYCESGAWSVAEKSCNPPAPAVSCPVDPPPADAACELETGTACGYGDCFGEHTITATCASRLPENGGEQTFWEVRERTCNPPPIANQCPAEPPERSAPCSYVGDRCGYEDCGGTPRVTAECLEGAWRVLEVSCNPPELDVQSQ